MARWFIRLLGIGAGLALAACDSGVGTGQGQTDAGTETDASVSQVAASVCKSTAGTRLKREYIEPVAVARQELRVIDAVHDVECRYRAEADGTYTCYPIPSSATTEVYFQDAACTSALARFPVGAEARQFTRSSRPSAVPCEPQILEFRLVGAASPVVGGQDLFQRDALGVCVASLGPAGDYYLAGPPLTAANFVNANAQPFSADTRISALLQVGADGSKMCDPGRPKLDSSLNVSCINRLGANGETHCMPVGGTAGTFFADEVCELVTTVVAVGPCELEAPGYVVEESTDACGAVTRSLSKVLPQEVAARYQSIGNACELIGPDTNTYYQVGPAAADSDFVVLSPETEVLEGRVKRLLLASEDRFGEFSNLWYDSKLETTCFFADSSDGSLRCLPLAMSPTALFSDVDCTTAINTLALSQECAPAGNFIARGSALGTRIFAAKLYESPVYDLVEGLCQQVTSPVYEENFEHAASSFQPGEILRQ